MTTSPSSSLYHTGLVQFQWEKSVSGLYFLLQFPQADKELENKRHAALYLLGEDGLGGERSSGAGRFEAEWLELPEPEPVRRFDLHFTTPTAFAQSSNHLPLPVPALMFRSWLERWNHFAPVYLGSDELIAYLSNAIALRQHTIKTSSFSLPRGYVNGFNCKVVLQALSRTDPLLANVANLLIHYAQFAGTGIKTRLGMGQTKVKIGFLKAGSENRTRIISLEG